MYHLELIMIIIIQSIFSAFLVHQNIKLSQAVKYLQDRLREQEVALGELRRKVDDMFAYLQNNAWSGFDFKGNKHED